MPPASCHCSSYWPTVVTLLAVVALLSLCVMLQERRRRLDLQKQKDELGDSLIALVQQHSLERVKRSDQHALQIQSAIHQVLSSLERLIKPG